MGEQKTESINIHEDGDKFIPECKGRTPEENEKSISRRGFLGTLGGAAVATGLLGITPVLTGCNDDAKGQGLECSEIGPIDQSGKINQAFDYRVKTARANFEQSDVQHICNGDEEFFENRIASYTKGLPHNQTGEVDQDAYNLMLNALSTGANEDYELIPLPGDIKLKNPLAGLSMDLVGIDSYQTLIPSPPSFSSAETAGEMTELYWMSMIRDISFQSYNNSSMIEMALDDLNNLGDFRGPRQNGEVTPATLFRADIPGVLEGPFLSQFLLKDIPAGPQIHDHKIRTLIPQDYLTGYEQWLDVQNGFLPGISLSDTVFDSVHRYIRNGRDLAENQHWDWPAQEAINALLIIFALEGRSPQEIFLANTGVPYARENPYNNSTTQAGFVTFHIVDAVRFITEAMNLALKSAWFQKWYVHRRLRPEEFGGRIHNNAVGNTDYPVHEDIFNSTVLTEIFDRYGSFLLPQAFPEGAPAHPAYPSGHATWAGATITVLKAFFDENVTIPDPVIASSDGLELLPYTGPYANGLTLGGELNKLAWNIATGRNFAGIHWRTDATTGLFLGEQVGISVLRDLKNSYAEEYDGFSFTGFDGTNINI